MTRGCGDAFWHGIATGAFVMMFGMFLLFGISGLWWRAKQGGPHGIVRDGRSVERRSDDA